MAYVGRIDEQDPQNLYPAVNADPSLGERMTRGLQMDFPNASGADMLDAVKSAALATPQGQMVQGAGALASAVANLPSGREGHPMTASGSGGASLPVASSVPQVRNPSDVLPSFATVQANQKAGRNYLGEVQAMDRSFNAERDTPQPTASQQAYLDKTALVQQNAEINRPAVADQRDPALQVHQWLRQDAAAGRYPDSAQNLSDSEQQLFKQVKAMLPGAGPKEVRSVMKTIAQATQSPTSMQPNPGPGGQVNSVQDAVTKSQAGGPSIHKLGAGQSMYQVTPDGTAKLMTTAPGGAAELRQNDKFNNQQKESVALWAPIKKEYNHRWDKITEDVADPAAREKALRELNTQHFRSLGVPEELADVPVSFKSFLSDYMQTQPSGSKLSREKTDQLAVQHQQYNKLRNRLLEQKFGNTLQFNGPTERK